MMKRKLSPLFIDGSNVHAGGTSSTMSFIPAVGSITITRFTADNSGSVMLGSNLQYRWVIIPGGVSVPDSWDYATVSQIYHFSIQ